MELLVVCQPSAAGQAPLPGVKEEVNFIKQEIGDRMKIASLVGTEAKLDLVIHGMKKAHWVHFACHGVQNVVSPTDSALILHEDSHLTLSKITELNLSNRDMAFLSACQTAKGDEKLRDEAIHLAGGMLVTGYRGVIATLWSVTDRDAPQVARDVYRHLITEGRDPDPRQAATALDHAVAKLRDENKAPFLHWVPFIHLGI